MWWRTEGLSVLITPSPNPSATHLTLKNNLLESAGHESKAIMGKNSQYILGRKLLSLLSSYRVSARDPWQKMAIHQHPVLILHQPRHHACSSSLGASSLSVSCSQSGQRLRQSWPSVSCCSWAHDWGIYKPGMSSVVVAMQHTQQFFRNNYFTLEKNPIMLLPPKWTSQGTARAQKARHQLRHPHSMSQSRLDSPFQLPTDASLGCSANGLRN